MSVKQALFVSESKLKAFTAIHLSVSPTDLVPFVIQAQDLVLREYLGATLYNELKAQVVANAVTVANKALLDDYISPALCNLALYYALPGLTYKVFQKSVLKPGSESSQNVGLDELKFLQSQAKDVAESYIKQMQVYLKNNLNLYPAYANYLTSDGVAPNKKSPYFSGIQTNSKYYNRSRRKNILNSSD
jgi:hypothetical protein